MEATVFFQDGSVESHRIPDTPERMRSWDDPEHFCSWTASDESKCADEVDRFYQTKEGFVLDRIRIGPGPYFTPDDVNGSAGHVVVPAEDMSSVKFILIDGEQVWPVVD